MFEIFVIIILGLIQGASEFLPISSSGHLVLAYNIFGIKNNTIILSVILHIATLLAVIICYRQTIWTLIKHPFCKTNLKLLTATIPTVILAFVFKDMVETTFGNNFIIYGFLITAIILLLSQMLENKSRLFGKNFRLTKIKDGVGVNNIGFKPLSNTQLENTDKLTINTTDSTKLGFINNSQLADSKNKTLQNDEMEMQKDITNINVSFAQSIVIGISQGLAVFPGISRSGSTIATSLLVGVNKSDAADFSFLLSIPVIIGGMLFEVIDFIKDGSVFNISGIGLVLGFLSAFLSGLLCIRLMLKFVKKQKLSWFSFYLVLLSILLTINQFVHFLY